MLGAELLKANAESLHAATDNQVGIGVFPGDNTIRDIAMMMSAATPHSSPGSIRLRNTCTAIITAWRKLDHAVKAVRLRFADGHEPPAARKCRG